MFYVFYPRCAVPYTSVHGYILGRVPLLKAVTRSGQLDQTTATKDEAQIERHLVRTHSKKGIGYLVGAVSHGRSNFANF